MTNTPDKSEMKACPSIDVKASILTTIQANREAGESQEVLARDLTTLFHLLFDLSECDEVEYTEVTTSERLSAALDLAETYARLGAQIYERAALKASGAE